MFTTLLNYEAHSEESSDVKKELKELRQMMEQMEQKIENLEERNRVLEQQANDQQEPAKEETIVV